MPWLYPLLRIYRRLLFWLGRRFSEDYDDQNLTELIIAGDRLALESGSHQGCELTNRALNLLEPKRGSAKTTVLDFGGGGGRCGFSAIHSNTVTWVVVETAAMVAEANKLLVRSGLTFVDSIARARDDHASFDITHVSSALQYTSSPRMFLDELLKLNSEELIFEKLVLTEKKRQLYFNQYSLLGDNIPGSSRRIDLVTRATRYRLIALPQLEFFNAIQDSYEIVSLELDPVESHLPYFKGLKQFTIRLMRR